MLDTLRKHWLQSLGPMHSSLVPDKEGDSPLKGGVVRVGT